MTTSQTVNLSPKAHLERSWFRSHRHQSLKPQRPHCRPTGWVNGESNKDLRRTEKFFFDVRLYQVNRCLLLTQLAHHVTLMSLMLH